MGQARTRVLNEYRSKAEPERCKLSAKRDVRLSIIGAGGHARVVADVARDSALWTQIAFYDDTFVQESHSGDWPIIGDIATLLSLTPASDHQLIIGSGDNQRRHDLQLQLEQAGWRFATVIHPAASVSRGSTIEAGTLVMPGAIINHGSHIGKACIINSGAIVEHDCHLGVGVHISPGAVLSGRVDVGYMSWIGAASVILQGTRIGSQSTIGAGAVVLRDIADNSVAVGNPARIIKQPTNAALRLASQG